MKIISYFEDYSIYSQYPLFSLNCLSAYPEGEKNENTHTS